MNTRLLLCTVAAMLLTGSVFAQNQWEIGLKLGGFNYQGDFAENPMSLGHTHFALGGQVKFFTNPDFALRVDATFGKISGDYSNVSVSRDWEFERNVSEILFVGEWHPLAKDTIYADGEFEQSISPFISLGLGTVFGSSRISINPEDLDKFLLEEEQDAFLVIPFSIGASWKAAEKFTVAAEIGTRYTFSDNLDGISLNGNPDANDWYVYAGITLSYAISSNKDDR